MTGGCPCICFNKILIYKKLHICSNCVNLKSEHYFSDDSMRRLPRQVFCFNSGNLNASYDHIHRAERFRRMDTGYDREPPSLFSKEVFHDGSDSQGSAGRACQGF